jgi:4-aminobutyrate aminotransferase-like enzyme
MGDHDYVLAPPLTSTSDEIDEMLEILDVSIAESLETFNAE